MNLVYASSLSLSGLKKLNQQIRRAALVALLSLSHKEKTIMIYDHAKLDAMLAHIKASLASDKTNNLLFLSTVASALKAHVDMRGAILRAEDAIYKLDDVQECRRK